MPNRVKAVKCKVSKPTSTQKAKLYDLQSTGDVEHVMDDVVWAHTRAGEDTLIDLHKAGKAEFQRERYPKRYDAEGNKIPDNELKNYASKDAKTVDEVKDIIAQKQKDKAIAELTKELEGMTKAQIAEKYDVSDSQLKADMIQEVIDKMFNNGE